MTVKVDPQRQKIRVVWVLVCAAAILLVCVSALAFALGYARGASQIPSNIASIQSPAQAGPDLAPPNESANLPAEEDNENALKISFDSKNEAHIKDVENFSQWMADNIKNYRAPESITQELVDFLDFENMFGPSRSETLFGPSEFDYKEFPINEFPIDDELNRYRLTFCSVGDFIESRYGGSAYWNIVMSRCLPPHYVYRGVSPAFSLYWSKSGCENRDYEFSEHFSDATCVDLQKVQFERIESLRQFLSDPAKLRHIFVLKRSSLSTFLDNLDAEARRAIEERLSSAITSAKTVLETCRDSLCAISEPDNRVSKNPFDTVHFVSASPIKQLIDYDVLLASQIYEIEFFVRRYNEGGRPLVAAYMDIMQEVADMAAEQPQ